MDFNKLFVAVIFVAVSLLALFTLAYDFNTEYDTSIGVDMNTTYIAVTKNIQTNISDVSKNVSSQTIGASGTGVVGDVASMTRRAWGAIRSIYTIGVFTPSLIRDAAIVMNVPEIYATYGVYIFVILFWLSVIYLFFLGVKSFFG